MKLPVVLAVALVVVGVGSGFAFASTLENGGDGEASPPTAPYGIEGYADMSIDERNAALREAQMAEALTLAEEHGGGLVEPYPEDTWAYVSPELKPSQVNGCQEILQSNPEDLDCNLLTLAAAGDVPAGPYSKDEAQRAVAKALSAAGGGGDR